MLALAAVVAALMAPAPAPIASPAVAPIVSLAVAPSPAVSPAVAPSAASEVPAAPRSVAPSTAAAAPALALTTGGPLPVAPSADITAGTLELAGRAPRGTTVAVRTSCLDGPCSTSAVAGRRGRWTVPLHVLLPFGQRAVRLRVETASRRIVRRVPLSYPDYAAVPPYADLGDAPQLIMFGDSLSVGTDAGLRAALPGWKVTTDGRVSRPLAEGMSVFAATPMPNRPTVRAFSLFTNDDPRGVAALETAVRASVDALGPSDCAVWATIVRPPVAGVSYRAANGRLRSLRREYDGQLLVVDWARAVARHRGWLSRDGVHPNAVGYAARARLYARRALDCSQVALSRD